MIKRIIFDIDNTLMPWKQEYFEKIKKVLDNLNIKYTIEDYNNIIKALDKYENKYYTFNEKIMIDFINKSLNKNYPIEFIENLIKEFANCVEGKADKKTLELLEYLKEKYEMVILTDWFGWQQKERLKNFGILQYFQNVYFAEKTKRKPFKEAFENAIGDNKPEECVMIGDNFERDIIGALNAGLQAIHFNYKNNIYEHNEKYKSITKLEELKKIL